MLQLKLNYLLNQENPKTGLKLNQTYFASAVSHELDVGSNGNDTVDTGRYTDDYVSLTSSSYFQHSITFYQLPILYMLRFHSTSQLP